MSILNGIYSHKPVDTEEIPQSDLNIVNKHRSNPLRWKGQFSPQLVHVLLNNYSNPDTVVFDPFVGSGTVLFEAGLSGVAASGTEINPAAAMLAQTYRFINLPVNLRSSYLQEVSILLEKEFIHELPLFTKYKTIQGGSDGDTIKLNLVGLLPRIDDCFQQGLLETLITLLDFYQSDLSIDKVFKVWNKLMDHVEKLPFSHKPINIFLTDARRIPMNDSSIDLVITSPPYINVFNYHQQYRASMESLNWNLLMVSKSEFGANRKHRGNRFLTVIQFCLDIAQALEELVRVCRSDARLIFIVGRESMVQGTRFFNGEIVAEIGYRTLGFDLILKQQRNYCNNFGKSIFEDLLHFSVANTKHPSEGYLEAARKLSQEVLEAAYSNAPDKSKSDIKLALKNICDIQPSPLFDIRKMRKI